MIPWEPQAPVSDGGSVEQSGTLIPYEGPYGKWGRFVKELRDNTDQVPLGFVTGQEDTWGQRGAKRVHIGQSFPGLEKRPCTVQPTIGAGGKKTRCAIIFRGKGTGITKLEKAAHDKRVDVFFQPKAWADSDFCMQWLERCFRPSRMADGKVPEERRFFSPTACTGRRLRNSASVSTRSATRFFGTCRQAVRTRSSRSTPAMDEGGCGGAAGQVAGERR